MSIHRLHCSQQGLASSSASPGLSLQAAGFGPLNSSTPPRACSPTFPSSPSCSAAPLYRLRLNNGKVVFPQLGLWVAQVSAGKKKTNKTSRIFSYWTHFLSQDSGSADQRAAFPKMVKLLKNGAGCLVPDFGFGVTRGVVGHSHTHSLRSQGTPAVQGCRRKPASPDPPRAYTSSAGCCSLTGTCRPSPRPGVGDSGASTILAFKGRRWLHCNMEGKDLWKGMCFQKEGTS